jgi:hypothetical protein
MPRVFMSSMQKVRVPMMQGWLEIRVFLVWEQARTPEVTLQQHSLRLPAEILRAVRLLRLSDLCTIGAPPHLHMCQHRSLLLITYALRSLCRDLPLNRYVFWSLFRSLLCSGWIFCLWSLFCLVVLLTLSLHNMVPTRKQALLCLHDRALGCSMVLINRRCILMVW